MNTARQLNWKSDLAGLFPHVEKCVNEHAMLLIAYLLMSAFSALIEGASFLAGVVAILLFLSMACHLIRQVWASLDVPAAQAGFGKVGVPILSLAFLQILFWVVMFFLTGFFVIPGVWWLLKSCLAIVVVVVEDVGALDALARSHKILNGRLALAARYLVPVNLVTILPLLVLIYSLDLCWTFLLTRSLSLPILLGAKVVLFLLQGVAMFVAQILVVGCLTYLYRYLKLAEAVPAQAVVDMSPGNLPPGMESRSLKDEPGSSSESGQAARPEVEEAGEGNARPSAESLSDDEEPIGM